MTSVIEASSLNFKRAGRPVLTDIGFRAEAGSLVALIGHNGAGKSTLIKLILGLIAPESGELRVLGGAPGTQPARIGYLPENVSFYEALTVGEHLRYFGRLKGADEGVQKELAEKLELGGVWDRRVRFCSKGQRQRLGLAQALLSRPELLLLDEPTVGLDPDASGFMYREIEELKSSGCTVVVCTHELTLIEPYLDLGLVLSGGRLKGKGTMDELRKAAGLSVEITCRADFSKISSDERLAPFCREGRLIVPEERVQDAVRTLTQDLGIFDFRMQKADLRTVYDRLVHGAGQGESK